MIQAIKSKFLLKAALGILLVILGDMLFYQQGGVGSNLGLFAGAWCTATVLALPALRSDKRSLVAAGLAAIYAVALYLDPYLLTWTLFLTAISVAVIISRMAQVEDALRWVLRLIVHATYSLIGPWMDIARLRKSRGRSKRGNVRGILSLLPLPLIGGAIFIALFANANPIIGDALSQIKLPVFNITLAIRMIFWGATLALVWSTLRPRKFLMRFKQSENEAPKLLPGVTTGSVTLSLIVFNALFAMQNALDLTYLWSGAPLPQGVTLASYAHRGAYPLIVTALLAGLFVIVALHPKSETAKVPLIRNMVVLWVVQNIFLVASSILRTWDYIEVYSLTQLRISALIWMGLVAAGLILICWRMLYNRTGAWLINANTVAAGLVLSALCFVDTGEVAARWNVTHAREVGGKGTALDLCYLNNLGPSALVPLVELEQRIKPGTEFSDRVSWVRADIVSRLEETQTSGFWTYANARRIAWAQKNPSQHRPANAKLTLRTLRTCDGRQVLEEEYRGDSDKGMTIETQVSPDKTSPSESAALTREQKQ
jgi:hypothetical protein